MFSLSMFGPFWCSVFRCSVPFEVRSFDIQSFDVRSHLTFSLSMFRPIWGSVFRCSVLFDVRSFEVRSFDVQSFEVRSFEVRSRFRFYLLKGNFSQDLDIDGMDGFSKEVNHCKLLKLPVTYRFLIFSFIFFIFRPVCMLLGQPFCQCP